MVIQKLKIVNPGEGTLMVRGKKKVQFALNKLQGTKYTMERYNRNKAKIIIEKGG